MTAKRRCPQVLLSLEELEAVLSDDRMLPGMESEELGRILSRLREYLKKEGVEV